jgi:hypothetical protein
LLSRLRLPAGTRRLPPTPVPPFLSQPADEPVDSALLDDHRFFAAGRVCRDTDRASW